MRAIQPDLYDLTNRFPSPESLAAGLADRVAEVLEYAVSKRGHASIAVSGGRTPVPFFRQLANRELPWDKVTVTLVDERWVTPEAEDSNERLVKENLLQGPAAAARFVGLYSEAPTPFEGEAASDQHLQAVPRPFDAVILGMGEDGHTASLFPKSEQLDRALNTDDPALCCGVLGEKAPRERITLTLRAILDSRWIALHIGGDTKWQVLEQAMKPGPVREYPVRAILNQRKVPVHVYWSP